MIYNLDVVAVAAIATVIATEFLKSNFFIFKYIPAQVSPRITAAIVALGASLVAVQQTGYDITSSVDNLTQFIAFCFATFLISAITYRNIIKR